MSGAIVLALRLLLAISLYAFLGMAFFTLWNAIRQQGLLLAERKVPPLELTILYHDQTSEVRHFSQAEVTIGRDLACECPVKDDMISARHARLSYHHGHWWLEDLHSTNGVLLHNERLTLPVVVTTEDEFTCGKTRFIIALQ